MSSSPYQTSSRGLTGTIGQSLATLRGRSWSLLTAAGFTAGYFVMYNGWVQLCWLAGGLALISAAGSSRWVAQAWMGDRWLRWVSALLGGVVVTSVFTAGLDNREWWEILDWVSGAGLLWLMVALWWTIGRNERISDQAARVVILAATFAALASLGVMVPILADNFQGHRLHNPLVYGGLNPVCTALTFGFAAIWASARYLHGDGHRRGWWLVAAFFLTLACLFTQSRGGLLALTAGHGVLLLCRGWRLGWKPLAVHALAIAVFVVLGTVQSEAPQASGTPAEVAMTPLERGPVMHMIARGDSSRLAIYSAGWVALQTPVDQVFGKGLWMDDDCWRCGLSSNPNHLHNAFLAALVQGGWVGLGVFMSLFVWAGRRLVWLARRGQATWLGLAAFGAAALLFDGHSPFSLTTLPRFEALILWMPLAIGSAAYLRERQKEKPTVM